MVIDGWGILSESSPKDGDAIAAAETPVMDALSKNAEGYTEVEGSSLTVGLPKGLMGNSEVGHPNIGAGRVVWQDVVRIDKIIKKGELGQNDFIVKTFKAAKQGTSRLHLASLISDGSVHPQQDHLYALIKVAKKLEIPHVYIHFFGDGRDTDPNSDGEGSSDPIKATKERYEKGETDEFLKPIIVGGKDSRVQDGDQVFFFSYRSNRVRKITRLLCDVNRLPLEDFPYPKNVTLTTMIQYKLDYPFTIAFKLRHMRNVLAKTLGTRGINQVHVIETKKYTYVTFFFNGGVEKMSAIGVAKQVCKRVSEGKFEFVMNNFVPPNIVGYTSYILFITSDQGNVEEMKFPDGKPKTLHTANKTTEGVLSDVAPTILEVIGPKHPKEMTSRSLLAKMINS
ncbi:hypothetical protein OIDMADRAFT_36736 [Oidiodendron maius Zn]|uniref:phosphoglycerate mutase (2,3-diphosphoglycerate-independent) n=1 Tax=Oidiodendron maius (strain Zn) TaxID=913774 RepID=A0A0C3DYH4_OIDMZ|nr:hypothetical protein OIDMADRAFT_36736 [Oidiodendron maius Zn]